MNKASIKDYCEITSSKRIFANEYLTSGVPFYRGKEITEKHKSSSEVSDLIYISKEKYREIKNKYGVPQKGDLLLTSVGTIGNPYLVDDDKEFYFKDGNLTWFRNFKGIDSKWFYYWLLSPQGKSELNKCTIGSSQKAYTINLLYKLQLDLPNLNTQTNISSIISTYDDLIENNEKRIRVLEEMAQRLYTEWFVKFKFPGHEKVKMVDSGTECRMIPEGWKVKKVKDSFEYIGGGTPSRKSINYWQNGSVDWYTPTDLNDNKMFSSSSSEKITDEGLKGSSAKLFPEFSVMMTSRATIGRLSINTKPSTTNQGFIVCIPNQKVSLYFLYYWLKSKIPLFIELGTGATFKEITKGNFGEIYMLLPGEELTSHFQQIVSEIGKDILSLQLRVQNLIKVRDLLIPQLVTGKRELKN